jgi:hypothetical protein
MPSVLRSWLAGVVLTAAALPVVRAGAQDIPELERRIDASMSQHKDAIAALMAYRARALRPRVFPDTVALVDGAIRVLTDHEFLPLVRAAAPKAESFIRERAGAQSSLLRGTVFAVWTDSLRRTQHGMIVSPRVDSRETDERYLMATVQALADMLKAHAQWTLGGRGKPTLAKWLSGELPIDTTTNSVWRAIRLELVSTRTTIANRCYAGDIAACKATLGLVDEPDPATAWYDSATRRTFVEAARKLGHAEAAATSRCIAGRDNDCIALMRSDPALAEWSNPPGSRRARAALVQQAFAMGGPGALERLMASEDTPVSALSAVARAPIDSVVAQWQRHAHDGGIQSEIATPVIALTAVGWILAMGALSLRSPRWR